MRPVEQSAAPTPDERPRRCGGDRHQHRRHRPPPALVDLRVARRSAGRWADQPGWLRGTVLGLVLLLGYGTVVHVVQLVVAAGDPYPHLPGWLRAYFVSLTVLDPLAAVLLARRLRSGVALTVVVLVTDAAANALANYGFDDATGVTAGRTGQAVITLLALGALAAAPAMWRAASRR